MGWIEGLIGGFQGRKSEIEAQNLEEARLAQQREGRIFEALLSSPDPEIQSMAVAGLLDSANPKKRKGGLRGWMGEMEQSPFLPRIQQLINTPVQETKQTIPSTQITQGIPLAPGGQPAAMPQGNVVQPGGAPPTPTVGLQTTPAGGPPPRPFNEGEFQTWYQNHAARLGLDPDPDNPQHFYDWRAAYRSGAAPDADRHWPSEFKREGHPNLIVDGRDTRTGRPVTSSGPPPTPMSVVNRPPTPYVAGSRQRQVFPTAVPEVPADEQRYRTDRAAFQAKFDNYATLYGPERARQLIDAEVAGTPTAGDVRFQEGTTVPDPNSPTGYSQILYQQNDPTKQQRIPAPAPTTGPTGDVTVGSQEDYILRKYGPNPTPEQITEGRQEYAASARAPAAAGEDPRALAEMAARNPAILHATTPTLRGAAMQEIAKDPQLQQQYEATLMQPVRAQAESIVPAFKDLLEIDAAGQVVGLTEGGKSIFGFGPGRLAEKIPGTVAATARAALGQITGRQILDTIGAMKAQSPTGATGFGPMSDRELAVLSSAATVLTGGISEQRALQELTALYEVYQKMLRPSTQAAAPGGYAVGDQVEYQGQTYYVTGFENGQLVLGDAP